MCTALRRVRGTLLRRGPWVIDGQLLLGTRPDLQRQTHTHTHSINIQGDDYKWSWFTVQPAGPADLMTSTLSRCLCGNSRCDGNILTSQRLQLYLCISGGSRLILALSSITSFATRPLLWSTEMKYRMSFTQTSKHTHTHTRLVSVTWRHHCSGVTAQEHNDWMTQHRSAGKTIKTKILVCTSKGKTSHSLSLLCNSICSFAKCYPQFLIHSVVCESSRQLATCFCISILLIITVTETQ